MTSCKPICKLLTSRDAWLRCSPCCSLLSGRAVPHDCTDGLLSLLYSHSSAGLALAGDALCSALTCWLPRLRPPECPQESALCPRRSPRHPRLRPHLDAGPCSLLRALHTAQWLSRYTAWLWSRQAAGTARADNSRFDSKPQAARGRRGKQAAVCLLHSVGIPATQISSSRAGAACTEPRAAARMSGRWTWAMHLRPWCCHCQWAAGERL